MSHVKKYSFRVCHLNTARGLPYVAQFDTTARTLSEAEADFRHYLRVHQPELLDQAINYTYQCEVRHV